MRHHTLQEGLKETLKDGVYSKELEYLGSSFEPFMRYGKTIYFLKGGRVCQIHHYNKNITMTEVTNANVSGKIIKSVSFNLGYEYEQYIESEGAKEFFKSQVWTPNNFWATFDLLHSDALDVHNGVEVGSLKVYASSGKGVDTFSVFGNYKALASRPPANKLTKAHLIGMLMNNQATARTDGEYTDDHARDASSNFNRGVKDNFKLAEMIHGAYSSVLWFVYDGKYTCQHRK